MQNALAPRRPSEVGRPITLSPIVPPPTTRTTRTPTVFGVLVILATLAGIVSWAAIAPLSSAVVAQGQVVVAGKRKQIQHRDGGIVKALHVRDGDFVKKGAALLEIDDTEAQTQIKVLRSKIESATEQLELLSEERDMIAHLLKLGLTPKSRLLELRRRKAELEAQREQDRLRLQMSQAVVQRSRIRAPVGGTVVESKVHTIGGVIRAGETILEMVPGDDNLIVEARVRPTDVDEVGIDLETEVRFSGFKQRTTPTLNGRVVHVSADALKDEKTGEFYFLSHIQIEKDELARLGQLRLQPGLPAEVLIKTGARTVLTYLAQPIMDSMNRALREQ